MKKVHFGFVVSRLVQKVTRKSSANHNAKLKQSTIQNFILSFNKGAALGPVVYAYRNILAIIRNNFYDFRQDPV